MSMKHYIVIIIIAMLCGCSKSDLVYVEHAKLHKLDVNGDLGFVKGRTKEVNLLLSGHYVEPGNDLVLLMRHFCGGDLFAIDDETYEKISIEINDYKIGIPIMLNSDAIRFYYSSGSSGFAYKGHGVYSSTGVGEITIDDINKEGLKVKFNITVLARPAGIFPSKSKEVKINGIYLFRKVNIEELSPWLGTLAPSVGKEVYP